MPPSAAAALAPPGDIAFIRNAQLYTKGPWTPTADEDPEENVFDQPVAVAWPTFEPASNALVVQAGPAEHPRVDYLDGDGAETVVEGAGMPAYSQASDLAVVVPVAGSRRLDVWRDDRRITVTTGEIGRPAWSPASDRLVYGRQRVDGWHLVSAAVARMSAERELPVGPFSGVPDVAWSPDGRRLAVTAASAGRVMLLIMRPDGTHVRPVADSVAGGGVTFSPDATTVLFARRAAAGTRLWTVGADGRRSKPLHLRRAATDVDQQPAWAGTIASVDAWIGRRVVTVEGEGFGASPTCGRVLLLGVRGGARVVLGRAQAPRGVLEYRAALRTDDARSAARRVRAIQSCRGGIDRRTRFRVRTWAIAEPAGYGRRSTRARGRRRQLTAQPRRMKAS